MPAALQPLQWQKRDRLMMSHKTPWAQERPLCQACINPSVPQ